MGAGGVGATGGVTSSSEAPFEEGEEDFAVPEEIPFKMARSSASLASPPRSPLKLLLFSPSGGDEVTGAIGGRIWGEFDTGGRIGGEPLPSASDGFEIGDDLGGERVGEADIGESWAA